MTQIDYLKIKLDDQEQYSRRTNLKIAGIKEQGREENTDDLVLIQLYWNFFSYFLICH
jgi:hypothetical protein